MILAYDLASQTGLAIGAADRPAPILRTLNFGGDQLSQGAMLNGALRTFLSNIEEYSPTLVVFEKPVASGVPGGASRIELAMGWRAMLKVAAYQKNVPIHEYGVQSVRPHFIGAGKRRRGEAKKQVQERCRELRWGCKNSDEADAAALWAYACFKMINRDFGVPFGLF